VKKTGELKVKKDWEIKKLYEVCEIECGTRVVRKVDGGTIYPVYGGGGATFKMDTYNREDCLIVSRFAMSEKCTRFVEGKFFLNDSGLSLKANENVIYQKYLETVILGKNDEIYLLGRGAAQKNLDMARFRELEISYPKSLEEQKRIVKILDEKFAQLETIKANAQTNLQNAKDLLQSQLTKAFSNTTWEKKRLGDVCDTCLGKMLDKNKNKGNPQPYLANINVRWGSFDLENLSLMKFEDYENERYGLKKGDLIICEGGEPGRCAIWNDELPNMKIQKALHRVRCHNNMSNYYLYYWFVYAANVKKLEEHFTGTTIKHLPGEKIRGLEIPIPPLPEQKRIVEELDTLSQKVRQLQEIYTKEISDCDELKQSLLAKAFEGNI